MSSCIFTVCVPGIKSVADEFSKKLHVYSQREREDNLISAWHYSVTGRR